MLTVCFPLIVFVFGAGTAEILVGSQARGGRKWAPRVE